HLVALFAAEAAASGSRAGRDGLDGSDRRLGFPAGGDDCLGERDAGLAYVDGRSGDELARLALRAGAERAAQLRRRAIALAPAACSAGRFHDLVDALVAQLQRLGELAQRRTAQVEASHGAMKLGSCDLDVLFRIDQSLLG